jgi:type III restriction enzyme
VRLQFDGNQAFQLRAIESVADLLRGQPRRIAEFSLVDTGSMFGPVVNRLDLNEEELLTNLQAVQGRNAIALDTALQTIEETIRTASGDQQVRFPNFSVEMETGTGKTYVYIRTALELNRRYGLRKFIVVVPSVAVREGVIKSLKITQQHLRALYDNVPYRYTVYDSKSITKVRQFATNDCVELMVMTIDSFNKEDNVIRQSTDRLQGATPLFLVQSARPILILDEPQNMESEARIRALASLDPLMALRYSATHRNPYNLAYRLTPFEAYRQGLVKKIEIGSVVKEDDFNQVFVRVDEIRTAAKTVQAKIAIQQRMAGAGIKEKAYLFKPGVSLQAKAKRPEYASFVIDEISVADQVVRFKNGIELGVGQTQGADQAALFREQIRYTVEEHFRKQKRLKDAGIKVLSLFFIDRVDNYMGNPPPEKGANSPDGLYPGIIRELFDEAFNQLKEKYPDFNNTNASEVRASYFAQKSRRGGVTETIDSTSGQSAEDRAAYNLIMKDKERLLSFSEPVSFIFSHSALKEGWDNPNVCQICTLNQTISEMKKRQEVGRGMRLVVDQKGERLFDEKSNILTVVVNESYELFVSTLQAEMEEAFGKEGAAPRPVNARQKRVAKRAPLDALPKEFLELWERIKLKTRYQVAVDTEKLIVSVVSALDKLTIDAPRIVASKAGIVADKTEDRLDYQLVGQRTVASLTGRQPTPNVVAMIEDLIAHITPPIKLTRRTLTEIISKTKNRQAALDNPQEFALQAARIVRAKALQQLVDGVKYFKDGTWYEMSEWVEEEETVSERLVATDKSIYDHIVVQSETERRFAERLKRMTNVDIFVKLPNWFKVATPVGQYNPDWALVMEQRDEFGDAGPKLYLVRETKSSTVADELRGTENQKIHCGERHFVGALGVDFKAMTPDGDLP